MSLCEGLESQTWEGLAIPGISEEELPIADMLMLLSWDRSSSAPVLGEGTADSIKVSSNCQTSCLWCAGLIANRPELVKSSGLPERSPDRQLLLNLYKQYGSDVAEYIAGTFAWIVWDGERDALVCVRDRMGNQGLYYAVNGKNVLIANRVELLLKALPIQDALNPRSIVAQVNGQAPLPGETFYESIRAVEPGGYVIIQRDAVKADRYWQIEPQRTLQLPTDAVYAEAFRELLFQVVTEYITSRRIAVTLSSGMDSTTVAAAIRSVAPSVNLTAFTWITPELPEADESQYAFAVCRYLNLPAVTIRADLHWPLRAPEGIRTSVATPFYNYYTELWDATFFKIRRRGIRIVFSGVSGDHLFGGNVFAYPDLLLTGHWVELARQIHTNLSYSKMSLTQMLRQVVLGPIVRAYLPHWRTPSPQPVPWLNRRYRGLYHAFFSHSDESLRMLPGRKQRLNLLQDPLLPYIVEQSNLQASRHGLELRHPLLDHRLVEFAASLPTSQTFRASVRKIIVRNAMQGYLPRNVLDLKDKIYPTSIADRGLRDREQAKVRNLMTNMRVAELGFVDEKCLQESYQAYLMGKQRSALFWHTLTLEDWLRRYF